MRKKKRERLHQVSNNFKKFLNSVSHRLHAILDLFLFGIVCRMQNFFYIIKFQFFSFPVNFFLRIFQRKIAEKFFN